MSALSTIENLAAQGEVEFFPCASDPLAKRTFRIKDKPALGYDIGWAVKRLQEGEKVCRRGWRNWGAYLVWEIQLSDTHHPTIKMRDNSLGMFSAWTCSQTDLFARDWELV